jgi:LPXTG-site transpeptidase (sortase) family protein
VREGDDVKTLRRAVGHIPGTALPGGTGNAALAGHRDTFFQGLRDIQKGDQITLSTPAGNARYVVRSTRVVDPSDVSVLAPTSGSTLTLVTCYPFNYIGASTNSKTAPPKINRPPIFHLRCWRCGTTRVGTGTPRTKQRRRSGTRRAPGFTPTCTGKRGISGTRATGISGRVNPNVVRRWTQSGRRLRGGYSRNDE